MAENTVATQAERSTPSTPTTREESRFLIPPVDIYETESSLVVMADLPGVSKEGLNIRVEEDILTMEGKVHNGLQGEKIRQEFGLRDFHRQFRLSEEVDQETIAAELKRGVLRITLPKKAKAQPRQISVRVA